MTFKTSIRVSTDTIQKLDQMKLTKKESYENVILRLLNTYEILFKEED